MPNCNERAPSEMVTLDELRERYFARVKQWSFGKHLTIRMKSMEKRTYRYGWTATIQSSTGNHIYNLAIYLFLPMNKPDSPSFVEPKCAVRCDCSDFFVRCYPHLKAKSAVFSKPNVERLKKYFHTGNVIYDKATAAPRMCKHLIAFCRALGESGEIADWYLKNGM